MFVVSKIIYKKFGECILISDNQIDMIVTTNVGPRIIFFGKHKGMNFLFEDLNDNFHMDDKKFQDMFGKNQIWHCYGGHRLWVSPENYYTYAPDNKKVKVDIGKNTVIFTSEIEPLRKLQKQIKIMFKNKQVYVEHVIKNCDNKVISLAPWALTSMVPKGIAFFKMNDKDTGFLPNKKIITWPYTNLSDPRLFIGKKYIALKADENNKQPFKLGLDYQYGKSVYLLDGVKFTIQCQYDNEGIYPDYGCSLETYTNNYFLEIETLGKVQSIKPKQSLRHTEIWSITQNVRKPKVINDQTIEQIFNQ
ncbi:MAG: hypothetical protein LBT17_00485 [Mycoplasmataceae bacterium]|nr:hypothetical protein [Mycoplasmataceae bacterium]